MTEEQANVKDFSVEQLKALAYDQSELVKVHQYNLNIIQQELLKRENDDATKAVAQVQQGEEKKK